MAQYTVTDIAKVIFVGCTCRLHEQCQLVWNNLCRPML